MQIYLSVARWAVFSIPGEGL